MRTPPKSRDTRPWREVTCLGCGVEFCTRWHGKTYCTKRCSRHATWDDRGLREQQIRATQTEPIHRAKVLEADDYTCYLCSEALDMSAAFPAAKAPTIDHVIPLARGGTHTHDNLRACCGECNRQKRDMTLDEFLARR